MKSIKERQKAKKKENESQESTNLPITKTQDVQPKYSWNKKLYLEEKENLPNNEPLRHMKWSEKRE